MRPCIAVTAPVVLILCAACAIWARFDGAHTNARSAVYTPGAGWSTPKDIANSEDIVDPALAVARDGNAAAGWQQDASGVSNLWASLFD